MSASFSHIPRKRFGQNFLSDQGIIKKIVQAFQIQPTDDLVEIGPGRGALTQQFPAVKHLTLIEIDRDLAQYLTDILKIESSDSNSIKILCQDVLTVDFTQLSTEQPVRVIGNLPYYLSSEILFHVLPAIAAGKIKDLLFMLQKEVVDRLVAKPNTKTYGRLSVLIQYYCTVTRLFNVPAQAFYPKPKVVSSILRLQPKPVPFHANPGLVFDCLKKVTALAFGQRRKMIRNTLQTCGLTLENWAELNLDPSARAENLSGLDYINLCHWLIRERGEHVFKTI